MEWLIIIAGFISGSIPYSVLITRLALRRDIRGVGDGNPGAFNVIRSGGLMWGGLAIFLDIGKGALPVAIANFILGLEGWPLVAAAIAPVLGHAFSPFLRFKGGKAIATTGGMWIGLAGLHVITVAMIMLVYWYLAVTISGWAVMFTLLSVLLYLILSAAHWTLLAAWTLSLLVLIWKHREDLKQRPKLKLSPLFRPFFKNAEFAQS